MCNLLIIIEGIQVSCLFLQESEGQKTNNGIQYSLHLLYSNGK